MPTNASTIKYMPIFAIPTARRIVVTVVPIFAPIMIAVACARVIMPAFTKPITITVVAPLDCIKMVAPAPIPTPANLLFDVLSKSFLNPLFATRCKFSDKSLNPIKNAPSAASM